MKTMKVLLLVSFAIRTTEALSQFDETPVISSQYDQSETALAFSPLNPNHILAAWNQRANQGASYSFSMDGGVTWSDNGPAPNPPYLDPSVGFDRSEKAFYCYLSGPDPYQVYISRTTDFGEHWFEPVSIGIPAPASNDKPYMAIDNTGLGGRDGHIYVSWAVGSSLGYYKILFRRSTNHGESFDSSIVELDNQDISEGDLFCFANTGSYDPNKIARPDVNFSMPVVDSQGDVFVVWAYLVGESSKYKLAKSIDGGMSFPKSFCSHINNVGDRKRNTK